MNEYGEDSSSSKSSSSLSLTQKMHQKLLASSSKNKPKESSLLDPTIFFYEGKDIRIISVRPLRNKRRYECRLSLIKKLKRYLLTQSQL